MTASLHKLTAGSGYDYLTRQVAAHDSTEKGHASLTLYYTDKGEIPGIWIGSGLAGLGDVPAGSFVDEVQMKALFGGGFHPNMAARLAALPTDATRDQVRDAARLGAPFKVYDAASTFQKDVAIRCSRWAVSNGLASDAAVPVDVRAEIRNELATEVFSQRVGREPSPLELSSEVARLSRNPTIACAGYDVTFTPVKSVSVLWALAPQPMAAVIEEAHNAAVTDAVAYLEDHVLYSRRGAGGVRQVDVQGLIAASFTHRDSRAGDPNLHTHVAIANKVQTLDGAWLAIDGRPLFAGLVSVSEVYNTQLEAHLVNRLGLRFTAVDGSDPTKRPVREIAGVPAVLCEAWSSRRAAIEARQAELAVEFQHRHLRPPTPTEAIALAQQATLETRHAKHEPRSLAEQRATWHQQAVAVIGADGIDQMLTTITHTPAHTVSPGEGWVAETAAQIVATMGMSRAAWNVWHLHAEASRQARRLATDPQQSRHLTEQLLAAAMALCVEVDGWVDPIRDPTVLRRLDGQSMYSHVGTCRFTSQAIIDAENHILEAATRTDGRTVTEADVSVALLAANVQGVQLNAGQAALVRDMATSPRRVMVGLAAAGSGKTTALSALASAWQEGGGTVIGLAPSAVAASVLRDQLGQATTLAKLVHDLHHNSGDTHRLIGPGTLVIIDEAGMADTPTLAHVVDHAIACGASVRLIGDDQQLAAVGAGGILRDLVDTHGAVRLTTILRFTDAAEAAASLALRDGRSEALGYYLDHDRIHPGSPESTLSDALHAWLTDQTAGHDSIMLTGTRQAAAQLNQWARAHRIAHHPDTPNAGCVTLADENRASIGDVIITRNNDRRLRTSATDWVKNGDRWTITGTSTNGDITARHNTTGLTAHLPARYVNDHVALGYAVTIHAAQGLTVDTTHTVIDGTETRQQLYVAMSRGRHANHAYVQIVDGTDENAPIHPTTLRPATSIDILEAVLARDGAARSATTEHHNNWHPAHRLGHATARYTDALTVATEQHRPDDARDLDLHADHIVDNLTTYPAWPTLRAHLLLTAAHTPGTSPLELLRGITDLREVSTATDPAAVLTWRLPTPTTAGPLPWLPPIPHTLTTDEAWGPYLAARADQVRAFADEVRTASSSITTPTWALPGQVLNPHTIADIEVWRAATGVDPTDRRPTGAPQLGAAAQRHQLSLSGRLTAAPTVWTDLLTDIEPHITTDPYTPTLAHRLAALHTAGVPVTEHLAAAVADGPLPDTHPAAALWWRLTNHLTTTPTNDAIPQWEPQLPHLIGTHATIDLEASPWWPHLATAITTALNHDIPLDQIIVPVTDTSGFDDTCHALLWRTHTLTTPPPPEDEDPPHPDQLPPDGIDQIDWNNHDYELAKAARLRLRTEPDHTATELAHDFTIADRWAQEPHTEQQLRAVLQATTAFYTQQLPGSWTHTYLTERFRTDITTDPRFTIGHAPAGWTTLVSALRKQGFTTAEMLAAGVATTTKHGNTIDRFRDRATIAICDQHGPIGFIGRRNPDSHQGPKYINSPTTALFHKSHTLYGAEHLTQAHTPVIVEGPLDAIAVTLAGDGKYIGVAPMGTALTPEQALLLRNNAQTLIATDTDAAGHRAAENAFWLLAAHRIDPHRIHMPEQTDPAQLLHDRGAKCLHRALTTAQPQAHLMSSGRDHLSPTDLVRHIVEVTAARNPRYWSETLQLIPNTLAQTLIARANTWTLNPSAASKAAAFALRATRHNHTQISVDGIASNPPPQPPATTAARGCVDHRRANESREHTLQQEATSTKRPRMQTQAVFSAHSLPAGRRDRRAITRIQ